MRRQWRHDVTPLNVTFDVSTCMEMRYVVYFLPDAGTMVMASLTVTSISRQRSMAMVSVLQPGRATCVRCEKQLQEGAHSLHSHPTNTSSPPPLVPFPPACLTWSLRRSSSVLAPPG